MIYAAEKIFWFRRSWCSFWCLISVFVVNYIFLVINQPYKVIRLYYEVHLEKKIRRSNPFLLASLRLPGNGCKWAPFDNQFGVARDFFSCSIVCTPLDLLTHTSLQSQRRWSRNTASHTFAHNSKGRIIFSKWKDFTPSFFLHHSAFYLST